MLIIKTIIKLMKKFLIITINVAVEMIINTKKYNNTSKTILVPII